MVSKSFAVVQWQREAGVFLASLFAHCDDLRSVRSVQVVPLCFSGVCKRAICVCYLDAAVPRTQLYRARPCSALPLCLRYSIHLLRLERYLLL